MLRICFTGSSPRLGKAELDWAWHCLATLHFTNLLILETSRPCKLLPDEHPPAPPGARLDVIVSRQTLPAGVDIRGLPLLEIEQSEYEQPAGTAGCCETDIPPQAWFRLPPPSR